MSCIMPNSTSLPNPIATAVFHLYAESVGYSLVEIGQPTLRLGLVERQSVSDLPAVPWSSPGIYILIGPSLEVGSLAAYVGKAKEVHTRLKQQVNAQDWWFRALAVVSGGHQPWTSADAAWLEGTLLDILRNNNVAMHNAASAGDPTLPEWRERELGMLVSPILAVLRVLGISSDLDGTEILAEKAVSEPELTFTATSETYTWLDACEVVLREAGKPMHSRDIVTDVFKRELRSAANARTPHNTVRRDLRVAVERGDPRFKQTGPATFEYALPFAD